MELKDDVMLTGPHGQSSLSSSRWWRAQSPNSRTSEDGDILVPSNVEIATQPLWWSALLFATLSRTCYSTVSSEQLWVEWGEGVSRTSPPFHRGERETQRLGDLPEVTQHRQVRGRARTQTQTGLPLGGSFLSLPSQYPGKPTLILWERWTQNRR